MEGFLNGYEDSTPVKSSARHFEVSSDEADDSPEMKNGTATKEAREQARQEKRERKEVRKLRREEKAVRRADKERRRFELKARVEGVSTDDVKSSRSQEATPRGDKKKVITYSKKGKSRGSAITAASSQPVESASEVLVPESQPSKKRQASPFSESDDPHSATFSPPKKKKRAKDTAAPQPSAPVKSSPASTPKAKKPTKAVKTTNTTDVVPIASQSLAGPSRSSSSASASTSSTPLIKVSQNTPTNVFQAPKKARRPKNPNVTDEDKESTRKETDAELRARLRTPEAVNAWLAEGWRHLSELNRLEGLGIITYRRGKFDATEKKAIKQHLDLFKTLHHLDDHQLLEIIFGKGRGSKSARNDFPKFWPELAAVAPGRPVRAVKNYTTREYDPRGKKGKWTKEEDKELLRAYEAHPNEWAKIAVIVDRTEMDCRDRYKGQLASDGTRRTGQWEKAEEKQLREVISSVNSELGLDPLGYEAPWDIVSEKMGGKRSRVQCRKKWQGQLCPQARREAPKVDVEDYDRPYIAHQLLKQNPSAENEIDWDELRVGPLSNCPAAIIKKAYTSMKKEIPNAESMSFNKLISAMTSKWSMATYLRDSSAGAGTLAYKSTEFISDDEGEEGDEEDGEEEKIDGDL